MNLTRVTIFHLYIRAYIILIYLSSAINYLQERRMKMTKKKWGREKGECKECAKSAHGEK